MKALDYHYNCIEVPLTPNNRVCDLARPSVRTKTKSAPFIPFPKEKKGPERLGNSWLPVLDFAILPCMSPVSRKSISGPRKIHHSYARFVLFDCRETPNTSWHKTLWTETCFDHIFNVDCSMILYFQKSYSLRYLSEIIHMVLCIII